MGRKKQSLVHSVYRISLSPREYLLIEEILKTFNGNKSLGFRSILNEYLEMKGYLNEC